LRETVLYLSHKIDKEIIKEFKNLKKTAGDRQVIFLYNGNYDEDLPKPNFCVTNEELLNLNYPKLGEKLVPGNVHFPFFKYFKEQSKSDFYWVIEYDVRFTGSWDYLFDYFTSSEADFLISLLRRYKDHTQWPWWKLTHPTKKIKKEERIASFSPVYRMSQAAAKFLDQAYLNEWKGHFEVSCPTLLFNNGFKLQDFGGSGAFVLGDKNKFYTNFPVFKDLYTFGTYKYRPIRDKTGFRSNKLYHPVKPEADTGLTRNLRYLRHRLNKILNN
jgi:hypothetical protein